MLLNRNISDRWHFRLLVSACTLSIILSANILISRNTSHYLEHLVPGHEDWSDALFGFLVGLSIGVSLMAIGSTLLRRRRRPPTSQMPPGTSC